MNETYLLDHVKALENKDRAARKAELNSRLEESGIDVKTQRCSFPEIDNYIVDFDDNLDYKKHLIFSGHYDAVKGTPGANDNASSVAVLLGLCRELKRVQAPVRVIFFDREEAWLRTPVIRFGLLGSLYYVLKNNISNIEALYNLEFCGNGDSLAIWPVKQKEEPNIPSLSIILQAAKRLDVTVKKSHVPGLLLSSDHLPFRLRGLRNSVSMSLLPGEQLPVLEEFIAGLSVRNLLLKHRPKMPGVLSHVHKPSDNSSHLNEASLKLMLSILLEIVELHSKNE